MASEKDSTAPLDADGGEKPVREQLEKATITTQPPHSDPMNAGTEEDEDLDNGEEEHETTNGENGPARGRLQKKRSHEEIDTDTAKDLTSESSRQQHTRKRSRDSTTEEKALNNGQRKVSGEKPRNGDDTAETSAEGSESNIDETGKRSDEPPKATTPEPTTEKRSEAAVEDLASPKTKRSRLHHSSAEGNGALIPDKSATGEENTAATSQSDDKKSHRDEPTKGSPSTSGFANTSSMSPFGAFAGGKSPPSDLPQTSAAGFAASGFSALSGATAGFGAIGKDSGGFGSRGGFGTGKSSDDTRAKSPPASSFDGALGQQSAFSAAPGAGSAFGSGASGFGKLGATTGGGGFGSGFGGGFGTLKPTGGLTSFASGKPSTSLGGGSTTVKAFGAPGDENSEEAEEGGNGDDDNHHPAGIKGPLSAEEDKQDERFYEQELETGEENETIEYSCRAKLYNFSALGEGKKEWRERGLGFLRLNVRKPLSDDDDDQDDPPHPPQARFLMRAEGSHRLLLNTPVKKEISFGAPTGGAPQGGCMYFMGTIDGNAKLELLQLKVSF